MEYEPCLFVSFAIGVGAVVDAFAKDPIGVSKSVVTDVALQPFYVSQDLIYSMAEMNDEQMRRLGHPGYRSWLIGGLEKRIMDGSSGTEAFTYAVLEGAASYTVPALGFKMAGKALGSASKNCPYNKLAPTKQTKPNARSLESWSLETKGVYSPRIRDQIHPNYNNFDEIPSHFYSVSNQSGGEILISTTEVNAQHYANFVAQRTKEGKKVEILTGLHGSRSGSVDNFGKFIQEDHILFSQYGNNVIIQEYSQHISPGLFQNRIRNSPNTVVCAWCWSERSSILFEAFNIKKQVKRR